MTSLLKQLKEPRTLIFILVAHALGFSTLALYASYSTQPKSITTADMQFIMDAQKLHWVKRMKEGDTSQVLVDSKAFRQKLDAILAQIAREKNTVIIDKNALVAGYDVSDMTAVIMDSLGLSASETQVLRQSLEDEIFADFPTMRKTR